ncbi:MAG: hypothetical protein J5563_07345 [Clostridia bacterium]|nr:hypothetical protein [Clostridia bacterium]
MKKIISLLLSALIVCALLTAFVSAAGSVEQISVTNSNAANGDAPSTLTSGTVSVSFNNGTASTSTRYWSNGTEIRCYSGSTVTISSSGEKISSIEISCTGDGYVGGSPTVNTGALSASGSIVTWIGSASTVTITVGSKQLRITSLSVVLGDAETPSYNTPKEIVDALYELAEGATLPGGPYTLTGVVTSVNDAWSTQYNNITVTIEVEGKSIKCFRMINGQSDKCTEIVEGDTITVTGTLKNYQGTREFDMGCKLDAYEATGNHVTYSTPAEIVTALYQLSEGASLPGGPYTLTGTVKKINTPYNADNKDVTITIEVEGKEIQCYKLTGDGVDIIDTDDTVKVTGYLKDYRGTKEFDAGCTLDSYTHIEKEEKLPETVDEIMEALYALENDSALKGTYQLKGKITKINTKYDKGYKNVTVTIEVEGYSDKPVMCYRLTVENKDNQKELNKLSKLKVGDEITVSGSLKNYQGTREFDAGCKLVDYNPTTGDGTTIAAVTVAAVTLIGCCLIGKKKTER